MSHSSLTHFFNLYIMTFINQRDVAMIIFHQNAAAVASSDSARAVEGKSG